MSTLLILFFVPVTLLLGLILSALVFTMLDRWANRL
jgi:hypothetical protein